MRVGSVNLKREWDSGRVEALAMLADFFGDRLVIDFTEIFSHDDIDLLRPTGEYVGTKTTPDDARSEVEASTDPTNGLDANSSVSQPTGNDCEDLLDDADDLPLGMDVEDFLPDMMEGIEQDEEPTTFAHFFEIEGKKILKASAVGLLSSRRAKKVTMRTLQAQGVSLDDLRRTRLGMIEVDMLELGGAGVFKAGDTASTLVQCGEYIGLALFEVLGFTLKSLKTLQTSLTLDAFKGQLSKLTVSGQLMELKKLRTDADSENAWWEWTGRYIQTDPLAKDNRFT